MGRGQSGVGQCRGGPWPVYSRREPILAGEGTLDQQPGFRLGARPADAADVHCACGASVGPARGGRALWLSHGGRYARPARQPVHSHRTAQACRDTRGIPRGSDPGDRRHHRCRAAIRVGRVSRPPSKSSRVANAPVVRARQPRCQHRRPNQPRAARFALEHGSIASQAPRRSGSGRDPRRSELPGRPHIRCARTFSHRLPARG